MKVKIKKRSYRYDIIRPRSRYGHRYSKYKKSLNMMVLISIKRELQNTWSSIYYEVKQHWGWVEKSVAYN